MHSMLWEKKNIGHETRGRTSYTVSADPPGKNKNSKPTAQREKMEQYYIKDID